MPTASTEAARADLRSLRGEILGAGALALNLSVQAAAEVARATTLFQDRRSGKAGTRGSIRGTANGRRGRVIAKGAAVFLEYGTRPHRITAHGKALRFTVNGETLFRKWVNHPGTSPRPFMHNARDAGQEAAWRIAQELVNRAIRSV